MSMFKSVVLLKVSHLETLLETQGPIRELIKRKPCARFLRSVKVENLVNLR